MSHIIITIYVPKSGFIRSLNGLRFLQNTTKLLSNGYFLNQFSLLPIKKSAHFTNFPPQVLF